MTLAFNKRHLQQLGLHEDANAIILAYINRLPWQKGVGVVAGGGVALVRVQQTLREKGILSDNPDQEMGINIVLKALEQPLRAIVENAGADASDVLSEIRRQGGNFGYNAQTEAYGDLVEMGILDPTKVVRVALQNAASVAGLMVTTGAMIAPVAEEREPPAPEYPM